MTPYEDRPAGSRPPEVTTRHRAEIVSHNQPDRTISRGWARAVLCGFLVLCVSIGPVAAQYRYPTCDPNPVSSVPPFNSFFTPAPSIATAVVAACSPVGTLVDDLTAMAMGETPVSRDTGEAAYAKLEGMVEKVVKFSAGAEVYLLKCVGSSMVQQFLRQTSPTLADAQLAAEAVAKVRKDATDALEKLRALRASKQPIGPNDYRDVTLLRVKAVQDVGGLATKISALVTSVQTVLQEGATNWMASGEGQFRGDLSRADGLIGGLMSNCQVSEAENSLRRAVQRGTQLLTQANLAYAQAAYEERRSRDILGPAALSVNPGMLTGNAAFEQMVLWRRVKEESDQLRKSLEPPLTYAGTLCEVLQQRASALEERWALYVRSVDEAHHAIEACRIEEAGALIRRVKSMESGTCGAYMTGIDAPVSSPMVPTGQVAQSSTFGLPSVELQMTLDAAGPRCGAATPPSGDGSRRGTSGGTTSGSTAPTTGAWVLQPAQFNSGADIKASETSVSYSYAGNRFGPQSNSVTWPALPPSLDAGQAITFELNVGHFSEWKPTRYGFEAGQISGRLNLKCFASVGADGKPGSMYSSSLGGAAAADSSNQEKLRGTARAIFTPGSEDTCFVQVVAGADCSDGCGQYASVVTFTYKRRDSAK
jgi:hypothetical protein